MPFSELVYIFSLFNFLTCCAELIPSVDERVGPFSSVSLPHLLPNLTVCMGPAGPVDLALPQRSFIVLHALLLLCHRCVTVVVPLPYHLCPFPSKGYWF